MSIITLDIVIAGIKMLVFADFNQRVTDGWTYGPTDGRTDVSFYMRGARARNDAIENDSRGM